MKNVFLFLRINLVQILGIILSSILFIAPILYSSDWVQSYPIYTKIIIVISFFAYILVQVISIKDNHDKIKLKTEIENWRKEAWLLLESHMIWLSKKLKFWKDANGFVNRLSLYKESEKWFYCVDRVADSEEYRNKSTKPCISSKKWILSVIWNDWNREEKWYFDWDIPSPSGTLSQRKIYKRYHKTKYNLEEDDVRQLHMKSVIYYWWRIDIGNKPIAILLFESTRKDKFTNIELDQIFTNEMPVILHALKFILPNLPAPLYDSTKSI